MWILEKKQRMPRVFMMECIVIASLLGSACVEVESTQEYRFGAWGLHQIDGDLGACSFKYQGADVDELTGQAIFYAQAANESAATQALEDLSAEVILEDGVASASCDLSKPERTGVELEFDGPQYLDTTLYAPNGTVHLSSLSGMHDWHAQTIRAYDVEGDVHLLSSKGSVDLSLLPLPNSEVFLELLDTSLQLALPTGLPYDLQVWGSPDTSVSVNGLEFEKMRQEPGFFAGSNGDSDIKIRIEMTGGSATIKSR